MPRALVMLLGAAAGVVVAGGVRAVAWLVGPILMALVIVIAVHPVRSWLRGKGFPSWLTTVVLVILVYGIMLVLTMGIVVSVARLAGLLPQYQDRANELAASASNLLSSFGVGPEQLKTVAGSLDIGKLTGLLVSLLGAVAGLVSNLAFLLALLLFLSVESGGVGERLGVIATDRPALAVALSRFAHGTRRYLVVTTVFGLIVAVLDAIALVIIGVPLAFTWGLLSFITNYIPNIGFLIGLAPPALLGLFIGGPRELVLIIVIYGVLNFVLQSLIQPRFVGDAVGLSATVTFVALVFWAWLLGPLGAILAIPVTVLGKALLVDIDPKARWADALLRAPASPRRGLRSGRRATIKQGR
nr:AI-2E family transporter [Amycolatopsis acididurans]